MQELITKQGQAALAHFGDLAKAVLAEGAQAKFAWEEFFSGQIRNQHKRTAYLQAVRVFLAWVEPIEPRLASITPGLVGES